MNWTMVDNKTLQERNTGFTIHLLNGTWLNIVEVRPVSPSHLSFKEQAILLRHGLEYAEAQAQQHTSCPLPEVSTIYISA